MDDSGQKRDGLSRALVILVTVLLVSCGLCGLSIAGANSIRSFDSPNSLGQVIIATGLLSGAVIVLSLIGIVVVGMMKGFNSAARRRDEDE